MFKAIVILFCIVLCQSTVVVANCNDSTCDVVCTTEVFRSDTTKSGHNATEVGDDERVLQQQDTDNKTYVAFDIFNTIQAMIGLVQVYLIGLIGLVLVYRIGKDKKIKPCLDAILNVVSIIFFLVLQIFVNIRGHSPFPF